ncbi:MAG TPA: cytochrome c3 family protein, partial [Candidatus Acidoferrum sp.]|nr:cytochrome c3 family protein [Candidatus Acidoferrum sp.]
MPRGIFWRIIVFLAFFPLSLSARHQEKPPQPPKQDEACLACHGQPDMKSEKGRSISIRPENHAASVHGILGCTDCHTSIKDFPHPAKIAKVKCETCHADEVADAVKSIHAVLGEDACSSCHGNVHEVTSAAKLQPGKCTECHASEANDLAESIH